MNVTMEAGYIQSLNSISQQLNRYLSPMIFLFGTIGNTLNCFVLSQRRLRTNPCALLFLFSSFIALISIVLGLPTRILAGWNIDPTTTNHVLCKLRAFIVFSSRTAGIWLITLATIDRWLLSCVDNRRRRISSIKNVKKGVLVSIILGIMSYSHMLFCYEANLVDTPLHCYGKNELCRLITDLTYILISILIPLILMIFFGLLTIINARHIRNRVRHQEIPMQTNEQRRVRKTDYQLFRMLCLQIIFLILLCIPQAIEKIYLTFQPLGISSQSEDAIKSFYYNIELLLAFIASGMPFYLYTLSGGSIFRKEFTDLLRKMARRNLELSRSH